MIMTGRKNSVLILLIILSTIIGKLILISYGLPFITHVDEFTIIKDPLKILLTYKQFDFSLSTNLYNWLLIFWHFIVATVGIAAGSWNSYGYYLNDLSADSTKILWCFRFLNIILATAANLIFIKFILRKLQLSDLLKLLLILVLVFNPIEWNANGFVKFDALAYLSYALLIYYGYEYFVERKDIQRKLYLLLFISLTVRIENVAFVIGYIFYDFSIISAYSFNKFFSKKLLKIIAVGLLLYSVITLMPLMLFYKSTMSAKVLLSRTRTFEEVITSFVSFSNISAYTLYIKVALVLLSPVVLVGFVIQLFKNRRAENYLLIPLIIINVVLAMDRIKNVFYFLLSSVILIIYFIHFCKNINARIAVVLSALTLFYFFSFDVELLKHVHDYKTNQIVREKTLALTGKSDTIIYSGIIDIGLLENENMIRDKITSIHEIGGGTGKGLEEKLKQAIKNPDNTRFVYQMGEDFYWGGTKYENKWLIGDDTTRLSEIDPKLIILFSFGNERFTTEPLLKSFLDKHYTKSYENKNSFADFRMNYRNVYYFHDAYIYLRK